MPDVAERGRGPRHRPYAKYVIILACAVVVWFAVRVDKRPDPAGSDTVQSAGRPVALTNATFHAAVAHGVHIVDFWAEWCGPCRTQGPILDAFARSYAGRVGVGKVDVDAEGDLARAFGISSIPTIIVFRDGDESARFVGVTEADTLAAAVDPYL